MTKKIEWDDSYSVNSSEIDEQHKKWIGMFNDMHECLLEGDQKELSQITKTTLKSMQEYADFHFKFEEEYMAQINFPDVSSHKRLHKDFDTIIFKFNRDIGEGKVILNTEIIKTIRNWLVEHILVEDKKYAKTK